MALIGCSRSALARENGRAKDALQGGHNRLSMLFLMIKGGAQLFALLATTVICFRRAGASNLLSPRSAARRPQTTAITAVLRTLSVSAFAVSLNKRRVDYLSVSICESKGRCRPVWYFRRGAVARPNWADDPGIRISCANQFSTLYLPAPVAVSKLVSSYVGIPSI